MNSACREDGTVFVRWFDAYTHFVGQHSSVKRYCPQRVSNEATTPTCQLLLGDGAWGSPLAYLRCKMNPLVGGHVVWDTVDTEVSESINGSAAGSSTGREGKDVFGECIIPGRTEQFFHDGRGPM